MIREFNLQIKIHKILKMMLLLIQFYKQKKNKI